MEINFPLKASPGRGKLSPQVTDEGAGKQLLAGNYPSSGAARHLPPKGGRLLLWLNLQELISVNERFFWFRFIPVPLFPLRLRGIPKGSGRSGA